MSRLRSGLLVAWFAAWNAGRTGPDDVLHATAADDAAHLVTGLGDAAPVPLSQALIALRRGGSSPRLVLPVPGDVRGVPGPAPFRTAALDAGEAVVSPELGLVPRVVDHAPSSAPTSVTWEAFRIEPPPLDHVSVSDAQQELAAAIRECASALATADVASWISGIEDDLQDARRAGERLVLPPGHPPRAVALLAQAERMQAVLDIAGRDPVGGAVDRTGVEARGRSLQPLSVAVRRARLAGYNALADAAADAARPAGR